MGVVGRLGSAQTMVIPARSGVGRRLTADAIRDVCSRPAVLQALSEAVPAGAIACPADRRQAVGDGVARALELALRLEAHDKPDRHDRGLLEEAELRLWQPLSPDRARLLQRAGPEGLLAFLVVEGAVRREAWRADTQRRRRERPLPLPPDAAAVVLDRDPIDLARFRLDVERTVAITAARTGLPGDLVYDVIAGQVTFADAGRRTGRTPNGLWMALARVRDEWRDVAQRGRAAGLGGGILVRISDRADIAVRRAIRWRLVGGVAAAVLLAGALGAALAASQLTGAPTAARPPVEVAPDEHAPGGEGSYGPIGRILAIEAAARLAGGADRASRPGGARRPAASLRPRVTPSADTGGAEDSAGTAQATAAPSCGLGSAALACR